MEKIVMIDPFGSKDNTVSGIKHEGGVQIGCKTHAIEYRPTQIHYLPLGTLKDKPSLLIVGYDLEHKVHYAQMSVEMAEKAFKELGLQIVTDDVVKKAGKWDALEENISKEYGFTNEKGEWEEHPEDDEDHNLETIGEKAATAFGYLQ